MRETFSKSFLLKLKTQSVVLEVGGIEGTPTDLLLRVICCSTLLQIAFKLGENPNLMTMIKPTTGIELKPHPVLGHSQVKHRSNLQIMSQSQQNQEFKPLPQYNQVTTSNDAWILVLTTKIEANGDRVQSSSIISKRG